MPRSAVLVRVPVLLKRLFNLALDLSVHQEACAMTVKVKELLSIKPTSARSARDRKLKLRKKSWKFLLNKVLQMTIMLPSTEKVMKL